MYLAADCAGSNEILVPLPPNDLRIDLKDRQWRITKDNAVTDSDGNSLNVSMVILGWQLLHGNVGMRAYQDFISLMFIPVSPNHRLLPQRCVCRVLLSGKSTQKEFFAYWSNLYQNRINVSRLITATKFGSNSFAEKDPITQQDTKVISYNYLTFQDREPSTAAEKNLIADIQVFMGENENKLKLLECLSYPVSGGNLIQLPAGENHETLRREFKANPRNQLAPGEVIETSTLTQGVVPTEVVVEMPQVDPKYLEAAAAERARLAALAVPKGTPAAGYVVDTKVPF